jgi:hypothetical protein
MNDAIDVVRERGLAEVMRSLDIVIYVGCARFIACTRTMMVGYCRDCLCTLNECRAL